MLEGKDEGKDNHGNLLALLVTFMWHRLSPMNENYGI
jgi:hypothetical protein